MSPADSAAMPTSGTAAVVLTGGRSSRMGTDKASLVVDGERMVDRVLRCVGEAGIVRRVVAGTPIEGLPADVALVVDEQPHQGPLGGLVTAWHFLCESTPPKQLVVLSCDLPKVDAAAIATLLRHVSAATDAVVAHDGERRQPLFAVYAAARVDELDDAFARGERSIRAQTKDWNVAEVAIRSGVVADADYPHELSDFRVEWPQ